MLRGIVLPHGYMDHIGGLSYLLKQADAPVYGMDLTLGMARRQLEEAGLEHVTFNVSATGGEPGWRNRCRSTTCTWMALGG